MRQVNSAYLIQQNNSYQIDPYNNVISSAASDTNSASQSDGPVSRKRLRNDSQHPPTPTIKNEPQKVNVAQNYDYSVIVYYQDYLAIYFQIFNVIYC